MMLCILTVYYEFGIPDEEYARGQSLASGGTSRTMSRANSSWSDIRSNEGYQGGNTHSIYQRHGKEEFSTFFLNKELGASDIKTDSNKNSRDIGKGLMRMYTAE